MFTCLKSSERFIVALTLALALIGGCASDSPPVPQSYGNERIKEEYMRGGEVLPKDEEIFYVTKAARVPMPTNCYIPDGYYGDWGKLFITDKATYLVLLIDEPTIKENWNYQKNRIEAEPIRWGWTLVLCSNH